MHAFSYAAYTLHDRAGTLASLLYKAEKLSVCLSVRPHFFGGQFLGRGCMDRRQTCST